MAVENNTPHRDYPLPHPNNLLEQDVLRIIKALTEIDNDMNTQANALEAQGSAFENQLSSSLAALQATLQSERNAHNELHRKQKINHLLGETLYPL